MRLHRKLACEPAAPSQTLLNPHTAMLHLALPLFLSLLLCHFFLTRQSHLREQRCFPADSLVKLPFQPEPQLLLSTKLFQRFHPPSVFLSRVHYVLQCKEVSVLVVASCPGCLLRGAPGGPRAGVVAGRRAACCSPHPAALAIACCTAPPVETMPL